MTAPDPTAGECANCAHLLHRLSEAQAERDEWQDAAHPEFFPASPPAVAASTGTSEDEPNVIQRIVNAWDCCGTCAGGVLAGYVAAREAAARAEERERIAQAIEAVPVSQPERGVLMVAAQIAREGR